RPGSATASPHPPARGAPSGAGSTPAPGPAPPPRPAPRPARTPAHTHDNAAYAPRATRHRNGRAHHRGHGSRRPSHGSGSHATRSRKTPRSTVRTRSCPGLAGPRAPQPVPPRRTLSPSPRTTPSETPFLRYSMTTDPPGSPSPHSTRESVPPGRRRRAPRPLTPPPPPPPRRPPGSTPAPPPR